MWNFFSCKICTKTFESLKLLKKHKNLHCNLCEKWFLNTKNLEEHKKFCRIYCDLCDEHVAGGYYSSHKRSDKHRSKENFRVLNDKVSLRHSYFDGRVETYTYVNNNDHMLFIEEFFMEASSEIIKILKDSLAKHITFKGNIILVCEYTKMLALDEKIENINTSMTHQSKMTIVMQTTNIEELYKKLSEEICFKASSFQERDSGWSLKRIKYADININQLRFVASSRILD